MINRFKCMSWYFISALKSIYDAFYFKRDMDYTREIFFWRNYLGKHTQFNICNRFNPKGQKSEFPEELLKIVKICNHRFDSENIKLLEVGSGPTSNLVWGVNKKLFDVIAIDPLADVYKKLIKEYDYSFPIRPIKLDGEDRDIFFEEDSFHIAYSCNALDHTKSPEKTLGNLYSVTKKGGFVFITSPVKEGTNENWKGLHKWDLDTVNDELYQFDKKGNPVNLTKKFSKEVIVSRTFIFPNTHNRWFIYVFMKNE